jgi:hypothetical protein
VEFSKLVLVSFFCFRFSLVVLLLRSLLSLSLSWLSFISGTGLVFFYVPGGAYFLVEITGSGEVLYTFCKGIGLRVVLSFADAPQPIFAL